MGAVYTQLSITERRRIERWRHAKVPVDEMARVLKRFGKDLRPSRKAESLTAGFRPYTQLTPKVFCVISICCSCFFYPLVTSFGNRSGFSGAPCPQMLDPASVMCDRGVSAPLSFGAAEN